MKTKIRVSRYSQNGYNFINFQILDDAIEPIGSLLFQGYKGKFYAPSIEINCSLRDHKRIARMSRIAKSIYTNLQYDADYKEIFAFLNGEEYTHNGNAFYPISDNGKHIYKFIVDGSYHKNIVAKDMNHADRQAKKYIADRPTIKGDHVLIEYAYTLNLTSNL